MDTSKSSVLGWVAIVIALIAGAAVFLNGMAAEPKTGEPGTRYPHGVTTGYSTSAPGGVAPTDGKLTIGVTGTPINTLGMGTCYFAPTDATIVASTTKQVDCQATAGWDAANTSALSNVFAGDNALVQISSTTATTAFLGLQINGCTASSTNGYLSCTLYNMTGTTYTWPVTGTASGTATYFDQH